MKKFEQKNKYGQVIIQCIFTYITFEFIIFHRMRDPSHTNFLS